MHCIFPQPFDKNDKKDQLKEQYWLDDQYNPSVLVGNWFEERSRYLQRILQHKSTYDTDYAYPFPTLDPNLLEDITNKNHVSFNCHNNKMI